LFAAVVVFVLSVVVRGMAWRTILQEQVSFTEAFLTINEGYLLNNILPFRLGEIGRAFLMARKSGLSFWEVLTTIVVERIFDVALMAGVILSSLPFVLGAAWARQAALIAAALVLVGFAVLYLLARNQDWAMNLFDKLGARWPRLVEFGRSKLESFFAGLATLREFSRFLCVLGWMLSVWLLTIGWYFMAMLAFMPQATLLWATFSVGITALGVSAPSSPAFVGVLEASIVGALSLFGVDASLALAYAITAHSIYFLVTVSLGIFGLARDGESLGRLYSQIRRKPD
jgi:uncharacterized protein (TIRG00374 family)